LVTAQFAGNQHLQVPIEVKHLPKDNANSQHLAMRETKPHQIEMLHSMKDLLPRKEEKQRSLNKDLPHQNEQPASPNNAKAEQTIRNHQIEERHVKTIRLSPLYLLKTPKRKEEMEDNDRSTSYNSE
jgi:hypothetical protein